MSRLQNEFNAVMEELMSRNAESVETLPKRQNFQQNMELLKRLQVILEDRNPLFVNLIDDVRIIPGTEKLVSQMENYLLKQAGISLAKLISEKSEKRKVKKKQSTTVF